MEITITTIVRWSFSVTVTYFSSSNYIPNKIQILDCILVLKLLFGKSFAKRKKKGVDSCCCFLFGKNCHAASVEKES